MVGGRRGWRFVLLSLASCILAIVVCEIALRGLGVSHPVFFKSDDATGLTHIPNAKGWYTSEGRACVEINAAGFRDLDRAVVKAPGTFRIAVLGDSYAEALQVSREESFPAVVERALGRA